MNNTAIDPKYILIGDIARTSNETLDRFKDTSIYKILIERRIFALVIMDNNVNWVKEHDAILDFYNGRIKECLLLNNTPTTKQ